MKRDAQSMLLVLLGAILLKLVVTDGHLNYVKAGLGPFVAISAVLLIVLGFTGVLGRQAPSGASDEADHDHGHDHGHGPRVAWLLLLPVLALLLVAPPALGSFSAARDTASVDFERRSDTSDALEEGDGPLVMTLLEYGGRSIVEKGEGLEGRQIRLIGFVGAEQVDTLVLTRMTMACCAADGQAIKVFTDATSDLPPDTWVEVTGTYAEPVTRGKALWPSLTVESVVEVDQPTNPYI